MEFRVKSLSCTWCSITRYLRSWTNYGTSWVIRFDQMASILLSPLLLQVLRALRRLLRRMREIAGLKRLLSFSADIWWSSLPSRSPLVLWRKVITCWICLILNQIRTLLLMRLPVEVVVRGASRCNNLLRLVLSVVLLWLFSQGCVLGESQVANTSTDGQLLGGLASWIYNGSVPSIWLFVRHFLNF